MTKSCKNTLIVGIGGIVGALARYGLSLVLNPADPAAFPWGTLLCNLAGCFALGSLAAVAGHRLPGWFKLGLTTGTIGSFTTFSTLSVEFVHLLQHGRLGSAVMYGLVSAFGGLLFTRAGMALAESNPDFASKEGRP